MRRRLFWFFVGYKLAGYVRRVRLTLMDDEKFHRGVAEADRVREAWKESDLRTSLRESVQKTGER